MSPTDTVPSNVEVIVEAFRQDDSWVSRNSGFPKVFPPAFASTWLCQRLVTSGPEEFKGALVLLDMSIRGWAPRGSFSHSPRGCPHGTCESTAEHPESFTSANERQEGA